MTDWKTQDMQKRNLLMTSKTSSDFRLHLRYLIQYYFDISAGNHTRNAEPEKRIQLVATVKVTVSNQTLHSIFGYAHNGNIVGDRQVSQGH